MRFFFLLLLLGLTGSSLAQVSTDTKASPAFVFFQRVDVQEFVGKPYRLTARVKVTGLAADSTQANVFASVFDKKKKYIGGIGFGKMRAHKRDGVWRIYTGVGRLPTTAALLNLSVNVYLNGTFGLDDFRLEVATGKDQWQNVPLINADFSAAAADSASIANGLPIGWKPYYRVAEFSAATATEASGNRYLEITGRGIVNYGKNTSAGRTVAVNGIKVYYETYGSGEPLLLLHGNGQSIDDFRAQIPVLAQHFRVIAVDTRAQGQSTTNGQELTYDLFAEDMNALLDALRIPKAHVVGWSDGGNTGLSLAIHHPEKVNQLVTMGANLYADTTAVTVATLKEVRQGKLLTTLMWPFSKRMRQMRPLMALLLKYPRMKPAELAAIKAQVLVLAGEKYLIKDEHTRLIARSIPKGQVQILPGLTHYAPQENPAMFNAAVLQFLQAVPAPPPAK